MPRKHPARDLEPERARIASQVRALRLARSWTLPRLAEHLHISKSRLSEIERGGGSFTAEQFLRILKLFNVPASHFTKDAPDHTGQLQNALARLGARHLFESTARTPSEALADPHVVIRETLLDGSPRLIAALAPVLISQPINATRLVVDTAAVGLDRRLGWVVENTIAAIKVVTQNVRLTGAQLRLGSVLHAVQRLHDKPSVEDILDSTIRSPKTLDNVRRTSSDISKRWNIASSIQPDDFVRALKTSGEAD